MTTDNSLLNLPPNFPEPKDDSAADHVRGMRLPDFTFGSTNGSQRSKVERVSLDVTGTYSNRSELRKRLANVFKIAQRKPLAAYYANAIDVATLKAEQERINGEIKPCSKKSRPEMERVL